MWGKIIIPMYRLCLQGLYWLYGPWCPLSPKRPINLISVSHGRAAVLLPGLAIKWQQNQVITRQRHLRDLTYMPLGSNFGYCSVCPWPTTLYLEYSSAHIWSASLALYCCDCSVYWQHFRALKYVFKAVLWPFLYIWYFMHYFTKLYIMHW